MGPEKELSKAEVKSLIQRLACTSKEIQVQGDSWMLRHLAVSLRVLLKRSSKTIYF